MSENDRLFEARRDLAPGDIRRCAGEIGLDVDRFGKELEDTHAGAVRGTPTFFVKGRMHPGSYRMEELEAAVRDAMGGDPASGPG